jgi:hypothetical protein
MHIDAAIGIDETSTATIPTTVSLGISEGMRAGYYDVAIGSLSRDSDFVRMQEGIVRIVMGIIHHI